MTVSGNTCKPMNNNKFFLLFIHHFFFHIHIFFTNGKCKLYASFLIRYASTDPLHVCGVILPKAANYIDHAKHIKYNKCIIQIH